MKTLPAGSVDAVVTDPPYGLDFLGNKWDDHIPNWIDKARSISSKVVFTTAPTTLWDYPRPDWVCCWHRKHASSRSSNGGFNLWSPVVFYGDVKIPADFYATHFGTYWREHDKIDHPSPKPIELYKWMINWITISGDTILDPFMGSGTTGVACVQTGRKFIGIEIDPGYFDIAVKRIKQAQLQMRFEI
jgi:DNA modification methylase